MKKNRDLHHTRYSKLTDQNILEGREYILNLHFYTTRWVTYILEYQSEIDIGKCLYKVGSYSYEQF